MGTRSQIRVVKNGYPLNYYHHFDGYFKGGVGEELHTALVKAWNDPENQREEVRSDRTLQSVMHLFREDPSYEPTFYRHFDIEYFYLLDFDKGEFTGWQTPCMTAWEGVPDEDGTWYEQLPNLREGRQKINLLEEIKEEDDN